MLGLLIFYLVLGGVLSPLLDVAVWGIAVFVVLGGLGYNLELNMVRGYYRSVVGRGFVGYYLRFSCWSSFGCSWLRWSVRFSSD